jgi:hypothetical protein
MTWFTSKKTPSNYNDKFDHAINSNKLDGKVQPVNQYSIKSKQAGKNTQAIKEGWYDSITTAHNMLVNVNRELDQILKELKEISDVLNDNKKSKDLTDVKDKFAKVLVPMTHAAVASSKIISSFEKKVSLNLNQANTEIDKLKQEDFNNLELKTNKETAEKAKALFVKIKKLKTNFDSGSYRNISYQYDTYSNPVKAKDAKKVLNDITNKRTEESSVINSVDEDSFFSSSSNQKANLDSVDGGSVARTSAEANESKESSTDEALTSESKSSQNSASKSRSSDFSTEGY